MKVKTLISIMIAGLLATGIGYAAVDDNAGTDSNSTLIGTNNNDAGEMGGMDDKQSSDAGASNDTDTSDQPADQSNEVNQDSPSTEDY